MDSQHTGAQPQAAWRPSLLPPPGATPRRGQAEPVRLLATLQRDLPVHACATAVGSLQSWLASLAALAFAGLGAALLLHWSPSDSAMAAHAGHAAVPSLSARLPMAAHAPAMEASAAFMPAAAAARIERLAPPQADALSVASTPPLVALAAITPAPGPRTLSAKVTATAHPARHAPAARHGDGSARTPSGHAPVAAASTQAPQADGAAAALPQADSEAALLQAVMEWHEQHAPPPAPRH